MGKSLFRPAAPPVLGIPVVLNAAPVRHVQETQSPAVKRKKKSRWGSEEDKVELPIPPIIVPEEINIPDPNMPALSGTWLETLQTVIIAKKLVLLFFNV